MVMVLAMAPVIELKGAIPVGLAFGIPLWETFLWAMIGSCLPAPFLVLLSRKILDWARGCKVRLFRRVAGFLDRKIAKGSVKVQRYARFGLYLFVAIPLPTTGVWTGSMIAGALDMRLKYAFPLIFFGNLTAGIIVLFMSHLIIL